jgi:hypothetical protein
VYGFSDSGCRRITATNGVMDQDAYCARFTIDKSTCDDVNGCKWGGQSCKALGAACDRGHKDTDATKKACTSCPSGQTTSSAGSNTCVACSSQSNCPTQSKAWKHQGGMCMHTGAACAAIGSACASWFEADPSSHRCRGVPRQQCEKIWNYGTAVQACAQAGLREKCNGDRCYCRYRDGALCNSSDLRYRTATAPW